MEKKYSYTKFNPSYPPPFSSVGYITYLRTYARLKTLPDGREVQEDWCDTINRIVTACNTQLNVGFSPQEQEELFYLLYDLKGSVAGRFLWQLGTGTVDRLGLLSLQNCAGIIVDEPISPFVWTFEALMLGVGVGFNISQKNVYTLPPVKHAVICREDKPDADFIVPDSREGWIKLLGKTLKSHFYSGKGFTYSLHCLRSKGAKIKTFGGIASGPDILETGITHISELLNQRAHDKLRPIDVLDIMNRIGQIVVSGNVRRSAQIAIGDLHDRDYLRAKRWDLGNIPNHRANSNNSIICNDIAEVLETHEFWEGYSGNGEPYGLINLKLARSCGRLGENEYPDPDISVVNPCSEQFLVGKSKTGKVGGETCCLAEIFLPNITSREELIKMATYLYRICKHSLALPCHFEGTEEIVHKNMRMGIGITGYLSSTDEQKSWLNPCYRYLRTFDREYSAEHGFPISIKLTTCKPSGTLSLLAGCTPGIHPGYARYYLRRIRFTSDSPLVQVLKERGYPTEFQINFDGTLDHSTVVVTFPCRLPDNAIVANECSAIRQLEFVKEIQTQWSDNGVSVTVYYHKEELGDIKEWLKQNYNTSLKSVSFLLHQEHGFRQAPYESITKDEYEKLSAKVRPFTSHVATSDKICTKSRPLEDEELLKLSSSDCEKGVCPIR